jgi:tRNA modification GTPase
MFYQEDNKSIVALATGKGNAALAILRISGKDSIEILKKCIFPEDKFSKTPAKKIDLFKFIDSETKKEIDEITAIKYEFPQSYTGENMVEIICHGNEFVIDEILSILIKNGIRFAKKGELTKRAFLNGKIDMLKAESINQIINSKSRSQYKTAFEMYSGRNRKTLLEWKNEIINILAEIDARIEFPEEDDIIEKNKTYTKKIEFLISKIEKEIQKNEKAKILDNGFVLPIAGISNAGKSSLFNIIMGFNRTIVHHEEGTTRDAISEYVMIKGEKIKIIDTAGLHETKNQVELVGIEKTWEYIHEGNMIIWVTPADKELKEIEKKILKKEKNNKIIAIISKNDIKKSEKKEKYLTTEKIPFIEACLINDNERNNILDFISSNIEERIEIKDNENEIICNKRHEEILLRIQKKGQSLLETIKKNHEEIISYELKEILQDFEEFVGEIKNEEILDSVFSNFCIGK